MSRILFMGGKPIGYEICQFLMGLKDHEIRYIINDYEVAESWYASPRQLPIHEIAENDIPQFAPELIIVAFYDRLLKEPIFSKPPLGAWNLHLADAEKYRGSYGNIWALWNGDTEYGVTLHQIDAGIDTGPILAKRTFPLPKDYTGKDLYALMVEEGKRLLLDCFEDLVSGDALQKTRLQSDASAETHFRKELSHELEVSGQFKNQVRALTFPPFPPPFFMIGSRKFVVIEDSQVPLHSTPNHP